MAESSKAHPSLEGIFQVLAQVPRDKLIHYKHKLSSPQQAQRSSQLLHSMILLTLKQESDAQVSLDALRDDPAAARIYQSQWGGATANATNPIPPKPDAEVGLAVAQIYSLLADEKLCNPLARDEAYRSAIAAFQSSGVGKDRFRGLLDEALEMCGMEFASALMTNNFGSRGGQTGTSPAQRMASNPVPIQSSSDPQPLRSTGSPTSTVSHLEISPSHTVPFLTHVVHDYGITETSKLCGSISRYCTQDNDDENSLESPGDFRSESGPRLLEQEDEPKNRRIGDFRGTCCSSTDQPNSKVMWPPDGTAGCPGARTASANAAGNPGAEGSSSHDRQTLPALLFGSAASTGHPRSCIDDSSSSKPSSSPVPHSVSSSAPPLHSVRSSPTVPQVDPKEFFTFVVLHASEDETVARRVKEQLETMGVSNGATYSEDFLIPGRCQLSCFQNALDDSAFTLLLLTENFKSRFFSYQANTALMDSLTRLCKTNTVIPFICKERPMRRSEMPILLSGLVPLDENSPVFAKRVKKTFTAKEIQDKKSAWSYRQQIQERQLLQEQHRDYQQILQNLSMLGINAPAGMPFPGPPAGFLGLQAPSGHVPQPYFYPAFPAPQPGPDQASLSQPFLVSLNSGGPQPHLIIQNAQMVQIGDYNHMQVEKTNATLGTAEEESLDQRMGNDIGNRHGD